MNTTNTRRGNTQKTNHKNNHHKVILDLIQDLPRLPFCKDKGNNMRGRWQTRSAMTPLCNTGAFTLIELLVVVLIIGILAAVALPQYQRAVAKSDFVQIKSIFREIFRARQLYLAAGGSEYQQDLHYYEDLLLPAGAQLTCVATNPSGECAGGNTSISLKNGLGVYTHTSHSRVTYKKLGYQVQFLLPVYQYAIPNDMKNKFFIKCEPLNEKGKELCRMLSGGKEATTCSYVNGDCWILE